MSTYLDQLNPQQRDAVQYLDGPELVIAGAGSGKTRVLTYKIVHLLARGYEPWRIMALTFTNKAADEMKERIMQLAGRTAGQRITMGTFHSVFARILRANANRIGYSANYTIYDAQDSVNLVKSIIMDLVPDESARKVYKASSIAAEISRAKNALILPAQYIADREVKIRNRNKGVPLTGQIYAAYCNRCRVAQAMDFDDLLLNTNLLLRDNEDVRRYYQDFYRYILVDEYQDTNFAQHMIVRQLTADGHNLCVVGDDAQSIYSFRGANIRNILTLKNSFPGLQTFKLEQNYRSTENIINAAGSLIQKNIDQIPKNVFSENGPGRPVDVIRSYSDLEEGFLVAGRISEMKHTSDQPFSEFAILYRTNAQSRVLEESLRKRNIPYRIYGGQSFYQRKEVKDVVAYFRLSVNPDDDEALRRVINVPLRGIGETTVRKLSQAAVEHGTSIWRILQRPLEYGVNVNRGTLRKLDEFARIINLLTGIVCEGAPADQVARAVEINARLLDQYRYDGVPENISRRQNVEELYNSAAAFVAEAREQGLEGEDTMPYFLATVSLATDVDTLDRNSNNGDCVTLMTIHAAKGLEFNNVFVVGVEEELLPSSMNSDSESAVEEERRLLYVAITRARRYCLLSYAGSRFRNGMTTATMPSRFLHDIDTQFLHFVSGSEVGAPRTFHNPIARYRSTTQGIPVSPVPSRFGMSGTSKPHTAAAPPGYRPAHAPLSPSTDADFEGHDVSELAVDMIIEHNRFGRGRIVSIDADNPQGARITVNFDNTSMRTLLLKFARFAILK